MGRSAVGAWAYARRGGRGSPRAHSAAGMPPGWWETPKRVKLWVGGEGDWFGEEDILLVGGRIGMVVEWKILKF